MILKVDMPVPVEPGEDHRADELTHKKGMYKKKGLG